MHSLTERLCDDIIERLPLDRSKLQLQSRRLAGPIRPSERPSTPRRSYKTTSATIHPTNQRKEEEKERTTPRLRKVSQLPKRMRIPKRHINNPMMRKRRHRPNGRGLLPAALASGGHEHPSVLARQPARRPEPAGGVPEGFPLRGECPVARGDPEDEGVEGGERGGVDDGIVGFGGRVHFGEDFGGERFGDSGRVLGGCRWVDGWMGGGLTGRWSLRLRWR